jgi:hypothetical protein
VSRSRPVSLALVGLFVWTLGCTSYRQIEPSEVADHGQVRVTTTAGYRQTVRDPWVEADSIRAHEKPEYERDYYDPIAVIPLDQVATLEAVGTNEVGTVLVIVGVVALVFVGIAAIALADGY